MIELILGSVGTLVFSPFVLLPALGFQGSLCPLSSHSLGRLKTGKSTLPYHSCGGPGIHRRQGAISCNRRQPRFKDLESSLDGCKDWPLGFVAAMDRAGNGKHGILEMLSVM